LWTRSALAFSSTAYFTNSAIELGRPQRGDVVVFRFPADVSTLYVKRLVGMPGDTVAYSRGAMGDNRDNSADSRVWASWTTTRCTARRCVSS
jgi:signal peptidase I